MAKEMSEQTGSGPPSASSRKSTEDRRCAVCGMKLSLYNPGPHCWQHTIGRPWRGPTAKPR